MRDIKKRLHQLCGEYLETRIKELERDIAGVQESASNETKSSAGDKYETGREMMRQQTELYRIQLHTLAEQKARLQTIPVMGENPVAGEGSLVLTNAGNYYIAVSAGKLKLEDDTYFTVSSSAPIGRLLTGTTAGSSFSLNGKTYKVDQVL